MPIGLVPGDSLFGWFDCQQTLLAFLSIMMIIAHQTARIIRFITRNVFSTSQRQVTLVTAEMFDVKLKAENENVLQSKTKIGVRN